jgi:hypothetical protein
LFFRFCMTLSINSTNKLSVRVYSSNTIKNHTFMIHTSIHTKYYTNSKRNLLSTSLPVHCSSVSDQYLEVYGFNSYQDFFWAHSTWDKLNSILCISADLEWVAKKLDEFVVMVQYMLLNCNYVLWLDEMHWKQSFDIPYSTLYSISKFWHTVQWVSMVEVGAVSFPLMKVALHRHVHVQCTFIHNIPDQTIIILTNL